MSEEQTQPKQDDEEGTDDGHWDPEKANYLDEWFALSGDAIETLDTDLWVEYHEGQLTNELKARILEQKDNCEKAGSPWVLHETPAMDLTYEVKQILSEAVDGRVDIVVHKEYRAAFCCRSIYKNLHSGKKQKMLFEAIRKEILLLLIGAESPRMLDVFQVYEDMESIKIITQWCPRGDLELLLLDQTRPRNELTIHRYFLQMVACVFPLHQVGFPHSDLKAEKFLLKGPYVTDVSERYDSDIVLADFSFPKTCHRKKKPYPKKLQDYFYYSPEMFRRVYKQPGDVWALGVLLYMMAFSYPPFFSPSKDAKTFRLEMEAMIKKGFTPEIRKGVGPWFPFGQRASIELYDLIDKMLTIDIVHRISLKEIIEHPWMLEYGNKTDLKRSVGTCMKAYSEAQPFVKRIMEGLVKSEFIPKEEFEMYRKQFSKLDTSGDGGLDCDELLDILKVADSSITLEDAEYMIQSFSSDGQYVLIEDICVAKVMTKARSHVSRLGNIFKMMDKSGDGSLDIHDLAEGLKELLGDTIADHEILQLIKPLDKDNSGAIEYDQFLGNFYQLSGHEAFE